MTDPFWFEKKKIYTLELGIFLFMNVVIFGMVTHSISSFVKQLIVHKLNDIV